MKKAMKINIVYDNSGVSVGRTPHELVKNGMKLKPTGTTEGPTKAPGNNPMKAFTKKIEEKMDGYKLDKDESKRSEFLADLPFNLTQKTLLKTKLIKLAKENKYEIISNELKASKTLYKDPDFKPDDNSIGQIRDFKYAVEWKRAKDINSNAEFIKEGLSRFDIKQGVLGDCWLLAVLSTISEHKEMMEWCCPPKQYLSGPNYTGMFMFRFWRFGKWEEVLIDDYLPVKKGTNNLLFLQSADRSEMWSALMEKAYAKLNGSYSNLSGGLQAEAMEDLTGGICEIVKLEKPTEELKQTIRENFDRCCLMGCSVASTVIEARMSNGIIGGHAYSVTGMTDVTHKGKPLTLIRCRNPWGNSDEWNGAWSDRSKEWNEISPEDRKKVNLQVSSDGEFWMAFDTFVDVFDTIEICSLGVESIEENMKIRNKPRLEENVFVGEWIANVNAGGCINNRSTYAKNPQFLIKVPEVVTGKDDLVTIGLMQKDMRKLNGGKYLTIGFCVYKVKDDTTELMNADFFAKTRPLATSPFSNVREQVLRTKLAPGKYLIMPSTFKPNECAKFIIRVFTPVKYEDKEADIEDEMTGISKELVNKIHSGHKGHDGDDQVKKNFDKLKDKNGVLYASGLMKLLNESPIKSVSQFNGFNLEMSRSMISAMDSELKGGLVWEEVEELWENCEAWKYIFEMYDSNKSGSFSAFEFRDALSDSGFKVCNRVFSVLVARFTNHETGEISFEDYIYSMVRLRNSFENLKAAPDGPNAEEKIFTVDNYLQQSLYI